MTLDDTIAPAPAADPAPREGLRETVGRLAHLLRGDRDDGGLGAGDLAELRRMNPFGTLPPAFWRLAVQPWFAAQIEASARRSDPERAERAWAVLVKAVAEAPSSRDPARLGVALGESGYAEDRFLRLLRTRGTVFADELRYAARWCAGKGKAIRWADAARFVLARALDDPDAEREAHRLARDFFAKRPTADGGTDAHEPSE